MILNNILLLRQIAQDQQICYSRRSYDAFFFPASTRTTRLPTPAMQRWLLCASTFRAVT
jgi:hypothetical protein